MSKLTVVFHVPPKHDRPCHTCGEQWMPTTWIDGRFLCANCMPCQHCGKAGRDHVGKAKACFGKCGTVYTPMPIPTEVQP